jgi:hypothetical protein
MFKPHSFLLALIIASTLALSACNGSTTNNYNTTIIECQLPTFTESIGNYMLSKWENSVQYFSPSTNNYPDVYIGSGYFTMSNYTPDAILLPTVSAEQRDGTQAIYNYFTHFLELNPIMSLPNPESNVFAALGCGYGGANGYYDFVTSQGTPQESTVHARFTFIYQYESQPFTETFIVGSGSSIGQIKTQTNSPGWYIWAQHSSTLPGGH